MSNLKDFKACYRVVIKGIVRHDDKILFVRERSDTWDLPGGGLEHGESIVTALRREFQEELAVEVVVDESTLQALPTWNTKFDAPVLILAFEAALQGEPSLTHDVSEFRYFSLDDAKSLPLDSTLPNIIEQIYDPLGWPEV